MIPIPQLSFRRILLLGLLAITAPILFGGIGLTCYKSRSSFLETAQKNLTQSAVRNGEDIEESIQSLRNHLVTASQSAILTTDQTSDYQAFLDQLQTNLPTHINCVQLINLATKQITTSTCTQTNLVELDRQWSTRQEQKLVTPQQVYIKQILPQVQTNTENQLELILASPVYNQEGILTSALVVKAALLKQEKPNPGILIGYPVVINQEGIILTHPLPHQVGRHIEELSDGPRLKLLVKNAIAGQEKFLHLFALEKNGLEVVAGYSSIPNPVTQEEGQRWVILAVSPLDDALLPLADIWQVLLGMGVALMVISTWTILFIANTLARPLEQLRDYALKTQHLESNEKIPQNFYIREIKQLSEGLNEMIEQLKTWAKQVEQYWEEAKIANQLKTEFLTTTSHELRTPLNGIINYIQFVRDELYDSEEEKQQWLQSSEDLARYLLTIINSILDISQIESGKVSLKLEQVDLKDLLNVVVDSEQINIDKKGLKLSLNLAIDNLIVYGDAIKLKQVIINIVHNAIKFTETGTITISTDIITGTNLVLISIKDTGIGIEPQLQDKLFRPFEMIDSSTTRKYGGTGLGLAISRNYLELMGGSINLYSEGIDKGTTVEIRLPILSSQQQELAIVSLNGQVQKN
jgi:signal transduction histidine kinase